MATDTEERSSGRGSAISTLRQDCRSCMSTLCCNCVDNTGGTLCFRPGKTNVRLRFMWASIGVLSALMWILFLKLIFGKQTIDPSPTDMRIIDDHISSVFCSRFSVSSESRLTVYELFMDPTIDDYQSVSYETSVDTLLVASEYVHRNFYMLKGSRMRLTFHSTGDLWVQIITGRSRWMLFTEGREYEPLLRYKVNRMNDSLEFTLNASDDIFIVYSALTNSSIKSNITLNRKVYDVTRAIHACNDRTQCEFELRFGKPAYIIYRVPGWPYNETATIGTYCNPRTPFYLLTFMFCPMVFGLSVTCLVHYLFPERERSDESDESNEHSRLLSRETFTSYSLSSRPAVVQSPPKYEDLERDGFKETSPPSYDEIYNRSASRQNRLVEVDLRS